MKSEDRIRIQHMLDASRTAIAFVADESLETLRTDIKLAFAIVRAIEIIGEAASRVSDTLIESHSEVPWQSIKGMRNRIVHAYFDINLVTVWKTVNEDLPPLITQLEKIISNED